MTSTTLIGSSVIDGIIINSHDLWKPISRPEDLYTVIIPGDQHPIHGTHRHGLSIGLTDITNELSKFTLQSRTSTSYFRRTVEAFLTECDIPFVDMDTVIAQISNVIVSAEDAGKKLGTLYTADSDTFAKMVINDIWSIRMWRTDEGFGNLDKDKGLYGTFDMTVPGIKQDVATGIFQLVHRDRVHGGNRVDFTCLGSVGRSDYQDLLDWMAQEFIDRWKFMMTLEMQEALHFRFADNCFFTTNPQGRQGTAVSAEQYHVGAEIHLPPRATPKEFLPASMVEHRMGSMAVSIEKRNPPGGLVAAFQTDTLIERRLAKLRPGVEIQVFGEVSEITEIVLLDEVTEAGTRTLIMSKASDGETFLFLIGARGSDHVYATGIPVADISDILLTV